MAMNRGSKQNTERGQDVEKGSGHGRQKMAAGTQPAEQALQANTAGGLSARLRPQNKRPQMTGLAAKQQLPQTMSACRAGKWGECRGTGSHEGGLRPTYTCPYPN